MTSNLILLFRSHEPILALAPMQDVTDLRFMRLISGYGNADVYFTEYFRVLPESRLDPQILSSITQNPTDRPVVAQMIGNDIAALVRQSGELKSIPVAAIDLNLGCPAPSFIMRPCLGRCSTCKRPATLEPMWTITADNLPVQFRPFYQRMASELKQ